MARQLISCIGRNLLMDAKIGIISPISSSISFQQVRYRRTKHWDPKWKRLRRLKYAKVDLPNFNERSEDLTEEQIRSRLKEQGLLPPRPWMETQHYISSTGGIFEPYVPPEGDGKVSIITAQGAKQNLQLIEKKTRSMMAIRKIKAYEDDFNVTNFAKHAEEIYIKSHEALMSGVSEDLEKTVTERAYPEVMHNMKYKTIRWKFLKNIEEPRVVHARCTNVVTPENIFAQVTVRFHTQQTLAIYDRFGRLIHGSEIIAKDVLEYVVFEKHVANEYGIWRVHDKIIPNWMPPKQPSNLTFKKPAETVVEESSDVPDVKEKETSKQEVNVVNN